MMLDIPQRSLKRVLHGATIMSSDDASPRLTHLDAHGRAQMVDVSPKPATHRIAVAAWRITMWPETLTLIESGSPKKGDVLAVARIAGIMAAKKMAELIPAWHPLALTRITIDLEAQCEENTGAYSVFCAATAETTGPTGAEMEAPTPVQIALLTIYDMCKAVDRGMTITGVPLLEKHGGKSGDWVAPAGATNR